MGVTHGLMIVGCGHTFQSRKPPALFQWQYPTVVFAQGGSVLETASSDDY
jgi:hypothetical protein